MPYSAYIFDLDGTLLNTLPDLVNLTNTVLREFGAPEHTTEEINSYVGFGARVLMRRALPEGAAEETVDEALARWKQLYPELGHLYTKPYPGIVDALAQLKERGAKLGVLSNKFDAAAQDVIARQFPDVFDLVRGECAQIPRKPNPTGLQWMMQALGVRPEDTAYVGDSGGDMAVALAAGAYPVGVAWGYRSVEELRDRGARAIAETPADLLAARA